MEVEIVYLSNSFPTSYMTGIENHWKSGKNSHILNMFLTSENNQTNITLAHIIKAFEIVNKI